jgi:hypothetical protein
MAHDLSNQAGRTLVTVAKSTGRSAREGDQQMSHIQNYEQGDMDYGNDNFRRSSELKFTKRKHATYGRKRGKSPVSVNGIHRRRNRKLAW